MPGISLQFAQDRGFTFYKHFVPTALVQFD